MSFVSGYNITSASSPPPPIGYTSADMTGGGGGAKIGDIAYVKKLQRYCATRSLTHKNWWVHTIKA